MGQDSQDGDQKGLGRIRIEDPRDYNYRIENMLDHMRTPRIARAASDDDPDTYEDHQYWWDLAEFSNQGRTPHCVSHAWIHWLEDGPKTHFYPDRDKDPEYLDSNDNPLLDHEEFYNRCQKRDRWDGEAYAGTSVRAGAKILKDMGLISEYRWTWNLDTLVDTLLHVGPVVAGTRWYKDMFYPDDNGVISVGGRQVGGHAYVLNGVSQEKEMIRGKNSWGRGWGDKGRFLISFSDMRRLINENGEICLATETSLKEMGDLTFPAATALNTDGDEDKTDEGGEDSSRASEDESNNDTDPDDTPASEDSSAEDTLDEPVSNDGDERQDDEDEGDDG